MMQSIVYEQYYKARPGTGAAVCNGGTQIFFADSDSFTRSVDTFRRSGPIQSPVHTASDCRLGGDQALHLSRSV